MLILVVIFHFFPFEQMQTLWHKLTFQYESFFFFPFLSILFLLPLVIVRSKVADYSWAGGELGVVVVLLEVTLRLLL